MAAAGWLGRGDFDQAEHWTELAAIGVPGSEQPDLAPSLEAGGLVMRAAIGADGIERIGEEAARAYDLFPDGNPWLATAACCKASPAISRAGATRRARDLREGARRGAVSAPSTQALCLTQLALMALDDEDWMEAAH